MMTREMLKNIAYDIGFDAVGVAPVSRLSEEIEHLKRWVQEGKHAGMAYMERNMEVREDPRFLVENAQSVIVTLTNYYSSKKQMEDVPQIAMFAWGKDYHLVLKERLHVLMQRLRNIQPDAEGRCFVDSAPLLEHAWAKRAGLGWQGKNTLLIHKGLGSFCLIGIIVTTLVFDAYDRPFVGTYCGTCRRCVEACPTGALQPGVLDATRCISYNTIENKGDYPKTLGMLAGNRIFGCDECQRVCPWNRHLNAHTVAEWLEHPIPLDLTFDAWKLMDKQQFKKIFKQTPLERTGLERLQRNLEVLNN